MFFDTIIDVEYYYNAIAYQMDQDLFTLNIWCAGYYMSW